MKQDKGKKMVVIDTGEVVTTTGFMMYINKGVWTLETIHKNGVVEWYKEKELDDYDSELVINI